jgi:hypothetical protein
MMNMRRSIKTIYEVSKAKEEKKIAEASRSAKRKKNENR